MGIINIKTYNMTKFNRVLTETEATCYWNTYPDAKKAF